MPQRAYKGIFFDLDGTLLPIDMDAFLRAYFKRFGQFVAMKGYDPELFIEALNSGVRAMMDSAGGRNDERFWNTFCSIMGGTQADHDAIMDEFYQGPFDELGALITPAPEAAKAVDVLVEKGYRLYLTTMPLFPRIAVEKRLLWAGCSPESFERITTFDNSTSTKPNLAYYRENIEAIGLSPQELLMVGNNTREDLVALELGLDGYLVTDWLLNPNDFDIESVKHGSIADFLAFAQALPACESAGDR